MKVPPTLIGKKIACPKCKIPLAISAPASPQPSASQPSQPQPSVSDSSAAVAAPVPAKVPAAAPAPAPDPGKKIKVTCENCEASMKVPPTLIGKKIACPKCKIPVAISAPASSPPNQPQPSVADSSAAVAAPVPTEAPAPAKEAPAPGEKIKFTCNNCEASMKVPPALIGKKIACPRCKQSVELLPPAASMVETESPAPAISADLETDQLDQATDDHSTNQPEFEEQLADPQQPVAEPPLDEPESNELVNKEEATPWERHNERERKRRSSSKSKGTGGKLMSVISGMVVGIGTLLVAAALFSLVFGVPDRIAAALDLKKPETKSTSDGDDKGKEGSAFEGSAFPANSDSDPDPISNPNPDWYSDPKPDSDPGSNPDSAPDSTLDSTFDSNPDFSPPDSAPSVPIESDPIVNQGREALVPSLKMFDGDPRASTPDFNSLGFNLTAKSEYARSSELKTLPEPLHYRGTVFANCKPSTRFSTDDSAEQKAFYPPESFATCLRLPEGIFMVPLSSIEYGDFITTFDGDEHHDVKSVPLLPKGAFRTFISPKRSDFPRVIASDSEELNGDTKGVTLIWVDRNSEIRVLENLDATGFDPQSTNVTFEVPAESVGGVIVDSSGKIAGLVSNVQNGTGTIVQTSKIFRRLRKTRDELFDLSRLPVASDQAGKIREASACVAQLVCKRSQPSTHVAFKSNIETQRGEDPTTKQVFSDRYDVNFKDSGEIGHFALYQGKGCRLPGFLGAPGTAAIIQFPATPDKTEWRIQKKLSLGPSGNDRILIKDSRNTNQLNHVLQTDVYRIVKETEDHLMIQRDYLAKSVLSEPKKGALDWDIPAGFPFHVQGRFTYRYDKSLKLATSIEFEGVEQKHLSKDLVVPLNLSFQMTSMSPEEIDQSQLPWKSQ